MQKKKVSIKTEEISMNKEIHNKLTIKIKNTQIHQFMIKNQINN
jgi:hypothetical protein